MSKRTRRRLPGTRRTRRCAPRASPIRTCSASAGGSSSARIETGRRSRSQQTRLRSIQRSGPHVPRIRLDHLLVERGLVSTRERARALILAGHIQGRRPAGHQGRHRRGPGRRRRADRAGPSLRRTRRPQAGPCARCVRYHRDRTRGTRHRRVDRRASRTCCCSGAPRAWWRSTSVTARSTGRFATTRASSSSSASTRAI